VAAIIFAQIALSVRTAVVVLDVVAVVEEEKAAVAAVVIDPVSPRGVIFTQQIQMLQLKLMALPGSFANIVPAPLLETLACTPKLTVLMGMRLMSPTFVTFAIAIVMEIMVTTPLPILPQSLPQPQPTMTVEKHPALNLMLRPQQVILRRSLNHLRPMTMMKKIPTPSIGLEHTAPLFRTLRIQHLEEYSPSFPIQMPVVVTLIIILLMFTYLRMLIILTA
jgi:hypothetical protein